MLTTIKSIVRVGGRPVFATDALFKEEELKALCDQSGAAGRALIRFRHSDGIIYEAAVGKSKLGAPMVNPTNLVAIPCPPECPGGKYSYTPDC